MDTDRDRTLDEELEKDLEPSEYEQDAVTGGVKKKGDDDVELGGVSAQHNETLLAG